MSQSWLCLSEMYEFTMGILANYKMIACKIASDN